MIQTLYIDHPPQFIPCWYCGQPCKKYHRDEVLAFQLKYEITQWEYHCHHGELDVEVLCVKHNIQAPNWFFNRIALIYGDLRLHWNFYSGNKATLDKRSKSTHCWEAISLREWPPKFQTYPAAFLNQSPEKLISFFRLYKVWS